MAIDGQGFLPTIKCSDCGVGIEISQLADHVCAPASLAGKGPASPPRMDRAATFGSAGASFNNRPDGHSRSRSGKRPPPPPRIDSNAANKPFYPQERSPQKSYANPQGRSAMSPRSPYVMNRSATTPLPRIRSPPSPDLIGNMDSAFPPFPRSTTPSNSRSRPAPSPRPDPLPAFDQRYVQPSPMFAPASPHINGGDNVARRMNSIAPGPFTGRSDDRRPSTSHGMRSPPQVTTPYGHKRTNTQGSSKSIGNAMNRRESTVSTTSTFSNASVGLPARPKPGVGQFAAMPPPPPPPPPKEDDAVEGIDAFLKRLHRETLNPSQAGQSKAETRDGAMDGKYDYTLSNRSYNASDRPPIPPIPHSARSDYPTDAMHTPSDSGHSEDSYASYRSAASSRSSPPISEPSHSRNASKSKYDGPVYTLPEEPMPRTQSPETFPTASSRPPPPPRSPERERERERNKLFPPRVPYNATAPDSPIDPAIHKGLSPKPQLRDPALNTPGLPKSLSPEPTTRDVPRRPTTSQKGTCRGCSEVIVGKSVKDSSGRLTGRYHKSCFVCRTCMAPFPTASFYVFANAPYCEQHYHALNGSLCRSCDRGIEGQYLETDQKLKFHPRCFCCSTCRVVLRDDYFEVAGRNYCERHAISAANQGGRGAGYLGAPGGPGGRQQRMQKRRTRLMMMPDGVMG